MGQNIYFMPRDHLQALIHELKKLGYQCIGPQVQDGAIVYNNLENCSQLPQGISEQQAPGSYKLTISSGTRYFAWANGPQAIKPYVFSPKENLWRSERDDTGKLRFIDLAPEAKPVAIIGVRACDIAGLYIQDKHFLHDDKKDSYYLTRRQKLFLVAVNCTHPADTCFCVSTDDGPHASYGYDIVLSELDDGFLVHGLSEKGVTIVKKLTSTPATAEQLQSDKQQLENAAHQQKRRLPSKNLKQILFDNLEHPRWEDVARRCLACGNCTSVCPTCFCHAEDDAPALDGKSSNYYRQWDSCFTEGHSYIHGITIRATTAQRYRQWLTHKLGSWHDQYGRSGCVGCGRCITWCPAEIDITEETAAICGGQSGD